MLSGNADPVDAITRVFLSLAAGEYRIEFPLGSDSSAPVESRRLTLESGASREVSAPLPGFDVDEILDQILSPRE